jgi:hypothetical protein
MVTQYPPAPFAILWDYGGDGYALSEESYATAEEALAAAMNSRSIASFVVVNICYFSEG